VVEDLDSEELAAGREPAREDDVLGRGLRVAAQVVAPEDGTSAEDRRLEDFSRGCTSEAVRQPTDTVCTPRTRCRTVRSATAKTSRSVSPMYWARIGAASAGLRSSGRSASLTPGSRTRAIREPGML